MIIGSRHTYKFLIILIIFFSCSRNQTTLQPPIEIGNVAFIPYTKMKPMEAIYEVASGSTALGNSFVCKVSKYRVSFFGNGGIFMILKYGLEQNDSSLKFAGFYRYSQDARQGLVNFSLPKADALTFLATGNIDNLVLNGNIENGNGTQTPLSLKFTRHFSSYTQNTPFEIYAHHGVQTVANPPFAENSLLGVLNDEDYGVNGLEFDV
ncbi:MAG TPA: hypothetical protein VHT72_04985, partial [Puia sp.]|nr:hypothetical protein [Puia sp.]